MIPNKRIGLILVPFIILVLILFFTDPYKLPLAFLIAPFVLVAFFTYGLIKLLLKNTGTSAHKTSIIATTITALLLLLLLLQSIRQLTLKDFLLVAALLLGIAFYFKRFDL